MPMQVTKIDSIAPGSPFRSDHINMGTNGVGEQLATNVMIMYGGLAPDKTLRHIIVVDTTTGERLKITFY
jgi:hypothetical protein